jgi:periplasmic divalent cation tolerance protein
MKPLIVITTIGEGDDGHVLARTLVERRLAACVNIVGPVRSVYRWQGEVAADREQLLVIKTTDARLDELREALISVHPYQVPEFVVVGIDSLSDAYRDWLFAACDAASDQARTGRKGDSKPS